MEFIVIKTFKNGLFCPILMETKCISTKKNISNDAGSVTFPCPKCGTPIVRSRFARQNVAKYVCPGCGFEGPN